MQVHGMGKEHEQLSHNITECIHSHHSSSEKKSGGGPGKMDTFVSTADNKPQTMQTEGLSLAAWMKNILKSGKKILLNIWGESASSVANSAAEGKNSLSAAVQEQVMAQIGDSQVSNHGQSPDGRQADNIVAQTMQVEKQDNDNIVSKEQASHAASIVQPDLPKNAQTMQTYFTALEESNPKEQGVLERVKVRFYSLTNQLARHSSNQNMFQAKQEQKKEDLRRRSHYRGEDKEMECVLTDDTYLLDSYDRKGEYSQLTTKK